MNDGVHMFHIDLPSEQHTTTAVLLRRAGFGFLFHSPPSPPSSAQPLTGLHPPCPIALVPLPAKANGNTEFRVEECTATLLGRRGKPHGGVSIGLRWLLDTIRQDWGDLSTRVAQDMDEQKEKQRIENAARRERVRKQREERERRKEQAAAEALASSSGGPGDLPNSVQGEGQGQPQAASASNPDAPQEITGEDKPPLLLSEPSGSEAREPRATEPQSSERPMVVADPPPTHPAAAWTEPDSRNDDGGIKLPDGTEGGPGGALVPLSKLPPLSSDLKETVANRPSPRRGRRKRGTKVAPAPDGSGSSSDNGRLEAAISDLVATRPPGPVGPEVSAWSGCREATMAELGEP